MKNVLLTVVAAALIGLLVWGFRAQPLEVDTAVAAIAPLRISVTEEGRTRIRERYTISAPVPGMMRRIDLEVGDQVAAGATLAFVDPAPPPALDARSRDQAEARAAAAAARLDSAIGDEGFARDELRRIRSLHEVRMVSTRDLEQAENRQRVAQAAVAAARSELDAARAALLHAGEATGERVEVRSPVDGVVLALRRKSEGAVGQGEPLLEVGDPADIEVEVDLLSADAVRIDPGLPVLLHRWGGDAAIAGRVRRVEPAGFTRISALGVEEQRVPVIVDLEDRDAGRRLGHGYRVEAEFILRQEEAVLQVPASALFRHGDGWAVFTVGEGRARLRLVVIGERTGLAGEIHGGLVAGEAVIIHPDRTLEDGRRVTPRQG